MLTAIENFFDSLFKVVLWVGGAILAVGPWITHIVYCIMAADWTGSAIALLIVGVVMPPVGWLHGLCIWFGWTWI